jgi:hypothetical protein
MNEATNHYSAWLWQSSTVGLAEINLTYVWEAAVYINDTVFLHKRSVSILSKSAFTGKWQQQKTFTFGTGLPYGCWYRTLYNSIRPLVTTSFNQSVDANLYINMQAGRNNCTLYWEIALLHDR